MAFTLGKVTDFDDANTILTPEVLVTAKAITLPTNKGVLYQSMSAPQRAITQKEFEIYSRTATGLTGVVGDGSGALGGWADSGTTGLKMTAVGMNALTVGSVLKVESEIVAVKSVNRTAYTIDVFARGMGGTSAAAHADTTAYTVIGIAASDGDLKNVESKSENTVKYKNFAQTIFEIVEYTQSELLIGRKGLTTANEIALCRQEAMLRVAKLLSSNAINGTKHQGTKVIPYMSAGLFAQLADDSSGTRVINRYNANSTAFSETILKTALDQTMNIGNCDTILVSPAKKKLMNAFISSRTVMRDDKTAGSNVEFYEYEGVVFNIMVDADVPSDRVALINLAKCQKSFLEGDVIRFVEEPPASSREHRESIQGTVAFAVDGVGYDHCDIYGLT